MLRKMRTQPAYFQSPMKFRHTACLIAGSTLMLSAFAHAVEDKMPSPDPDLPQPFNVGIAQALLENSPFTRTLDLSDTLRLTGIAYVQGKAVATLVNKTTKQSYLVSDTPNAEGWRLAEASASSALNQTHIKLTVGSELVTIRYSDTQISPPKKGFDPLNPPTEKDFLSKDDNGKPYVRGSPYMIAEDYKRYKSLNKASHTLFMKFLHDNRDKMFSASPAERSELAHKGLNTAEGK